VPGRRGAALAVLSCMREFFDRPVAAYMSLAVETAGPDTPIEEIARAMHARDVSGIPIVDHAKLVGVITRTDLIRLGAFQTGRRWTSPAMPLPHRKAKEVMTAYPRVITATATLRNAAQIMSEHAIHRLFVIDAQEQVAGVLSTRDLAAAVADARLAVPVSAVMTSPIIQLDHRAPLSAAIDLLAHIQITGLVVTEDGRPIGVFTQLDALASRDLPRSTPIETTFDAAVICLPHDTKLHRAAAHAVQLDVRRVVVCKERDAIGIVSGLDFARAVAVS
ncbi:MAG TPA: CBS domain-containing protein, partial [Kofleriaceae bacterium]